MESHARDWIGAAACFEGPRPGARFGDLPRPHKQELLRLAAAAAMSIAFFILLGISSRLLASRSLAGRVALPQTVAARPVSLQMDQDARPALLIDLNDRPSSPPPAAHIYHRPFARQVMAIDAPLPASPLQPDQPARRNPVSRFVRAMFHATAAMTASPDAR